MSQAVAASLAFPFAGAVLALLVGERYCRAVAVATVTVTLASAAAAVFSIFPSELVVALGALRWLDSVDKGLFGYLLDPLSAIVLLVVAGIGFLVGLYATGYLGPGNLEHPVRQGSPRFYFWLLAFEGSMVGLVISPNLLQLFLFWEMTTLCSWALISYYQSQESVAAGFKALIMTHIGGFGFVVALALLYASTGSFTFSALAGAPAGIKVACFALLLVAAWAKAAQVPFHTWLPSAMAAPTPVSAYLHAAAMVKAGVFLMARVVLSAKPAPHAIGEVMLMMALLTIAVAVFFMVLQNDLKRMLAFSTIAHLGYVLVGVGLGALGSTIGYRGAVLHILCHSVAKTTLFLVVGALAYATGSRNINALTGLSRKMPVEAMAYFTGALAAAGIPPLACFWSKFYILAGALDVGGTAGVAVMVFLLVESAIVLGWLIYVGHRIFFGAAPAPATAARPAEEGALGPRPVAMSAVLIMATALCVLVPWLGLWMVQWLRLLP
jgi:hydrogenase-4 component D